ncbi:MAG TPA: N-acetyl-gamma-glutamyl-phosphate reductase [Polyangia bacterium]|jgi:N-acetyl-gamma-glutamyl-phosphate reductase|nr:N-acetyl-gamma-glutamyl-phosphate reductase [Polyangia bacterium]
MHKPPSQTTSNASSPSGPSGPSGGRGGASHPLALGIAGARGYVGAELLRLVARHPGFRVAAVVSRSLAGQPVQKAAPDCPLDLKFVDLDPSGAAALGLDAWVLALPNGEAPAWAAAFAAARPDTVLVDVSADHRFDDGWCYGLPERHRDTLRGARRIANPGCYATGVQLGFGPLLPLLADGALPVAFGVSGYSGAGTAPSPRNDTSRLRDNLMPYALDDHIHEREASRHLGHPIRFLPHVAPFFRGITLTLSLTLREPASAGALFKDCVAAYAGEPLVRVVRDIPEVRDAAGHHHVTLGGFAVSTSGGGTRAALVVTLDNLLKGAATQALQNLNLACGFPELTGIL